MADAQLRGSDKVAAFLLSLDEAQAVDLIKHLPDYLVGEVAEAMTNLDASAATEERIHLLFKDVATKTVRVSGDKDMPMTDADRKTWHDTALGLHELQVVLRLDK